MTDSLEARRAALVEEVREVVGNAMGFASLCWEPTPTGVFDSERAAQEVEDATWLIVRGFEESRPPVDVEAALDGLTRYDTDWENGNSIAAKDYGKYVLHSEVLDLLRTVTTRED